MNVAIPQSPAPVAGAVRPSAARRAKRALLSAASSAGVAAVVRSSEWRRRRVAVLCYHGISLDDEHEWDPCLYMSAEQLEERLAHLRRHDYAVLGLEEASAHVVRGTLPRRSVVLTFDDGYFDFHARAMPLLSRYDMPATVYLTTYYCDDNRPVFGIFCSYLLYKARRDRVDLRDALPGAGPWRLDSAGAREWVRRDIVRLALEQRLSAAEKDEIARTLAERLDVDHGCLVARRMLHLMRPDEVTEVARRGASVELHTHRHRVPRERAAFLKELEENRAHIRSLTGRVPRHFCYPSGEHDPSFLPWLREAGVMTGTTCEPGLAGPNDEPLLLPRIIDTSVTSLSEFDSWVSGMAEWLPRRT